MKRAFEVEDSKIINNILDSAVYGTLALSNNTGEPYSVPVNFVRIDECLYFHGSFGGRKMKLIKDNNKVSFNVVEPYSFIASYFSSKEGSACPATQFFKSVIMDGKVEFIQNKKEKIRAFYALMQKHQPEGKYIEFESKTYDDALNAVAVLKIIPTTMRAKFKFGQNLTEERFNMIVTHLKERGNKEDLETIELMQKLYSK